MATGRKDEKKPCRVDGRVIQAPAGRGEELRLHLASHGIKAVSSRPTEALPDRLVLEEGEDSGIVQAILDQWER